MRSFRKAKNDWVKVEQKGRGKHAKKHRRKMGGECNMEEKTQTTTQPLYVDIQEGNFIVCSDYIFAGKCVVCGQLTTLNFYHDGKAIRCHDGCLEEFVKVHPEWFCIEK